MLKARLNWREIWDCKQPGMMLGAAGVEAKKAGYKYFCQNGRIFVTSDMTEVECIRIISA